MPPVRWKPWFYVMAIFVQVAFVAAAQQMQDSISMSADGWRPILGSGRQQSVKSELEIKQYANPNQSFDVIPSEVIDIEVTTQPFNQRSTAPQQMPVTNGVVIKQRKQGAKAKISQKTTNHYFLPSGPQQSSMPAEGQQLTNRKKMRVVKKPMMIQTKTRKPMRGQALAHSSRNEIFLPPPSHNLGGFQYINTAPASNVKTREAQGFGLLGNSFGINQQNAHIELGRFPLTGENILQRPTFFLAKPMQNDEFTRNLVPPPRARVPQKSKDTKISLYAFKDPAGAASDATSNIPQFGVRPNQFLPQAHPPIEFATNQQIQQQKTHQQQLKEQAIDVQVTKENLKQYTNGNQNFVAPVAFGTLSGRNHFPIGYVDYNFQKPSALQTQSQPQLQTQSQPQLQAPTQSQLPNSLNTLTYEVTEGKYLDTPPSQQYQFRPQGGFFQFQNLRQPPQAPPNARPGLLFQPDVSTPRPVFQSPLVDLSVPAFLPTPYKPENGVIPTSPTQSEAATVFNQVSNKMNRFRNNALQDNPLFFDIKDVSTHYPILGKPEGQAEGIVDTESPLPMNENGEISNEITTQKELQRERTRRPTKEPTTKSTSTRDPTKSRISNRRRPRPKKPSTTTTEEPVVETYQSMKSHEIVEEPPKSDEEAPVETERPQRRRRPRPTAYRHRESQSGEREQVETKKYTDDETPSKQRGRYRFRTRERPATERSDANVSQRKRLRPTYSENISKEQQKQSFEETTETASVEHEQFSFEREPSSEQTYSQEASAQSDENLSAQNVHVFETDKHYGEQPIRPENNRPFIEEIHPATQRTEVYERTRLPSTSTTEESNTIFHIPENEVDYTTHSQVAQDVSVEDITTTTTPQPTTTADITTIKSTRIRRPSKFDSSNRPRFSVKDYRQRLNQFTSTTPSSTTQVKSTPSENNPRLRFPNRLRTKSSPTTASSRVDEDVTGETTTTMRSRFRPKDPRHQASTESGDLPITEKSVASANNRVRPFGRPKTTTEATTVAPKVSIRPNLFSARRRAGYPSLKSRIQNKLKKNEEEDGDDDVETTTSSLNEIDDVEPLNVAETATTEITSTTTDLGSNQLTSEEVSTQFVDDSVTEETMKNDDFMYSQRVSDLTSSFKDYDKPGVFNSVAPTSRSIPNYFTISTDDPILPIEAFFPSLKEKSRER